MTSCTAGVTVCPDSSICPGSGVCPAVSCAPGTVANSGDPFPTSLDCPVGGNPVAILPIAYALDTGTTTKTAIDITNNFNATQNQNHVFCGYCADNGSGSFITPAIPCTSKADCPTGAKNCRQKTGGAFGQGTARTIAETGLVAGALTTGGAPKSANAATVFCIAQTGSAADIPADLPGPGAACVKGSVQLLP